MEVKRVQSIYNCNIKDEQNNFAQAKECGKGMLEGQQRGSCRIMGGRKHK